MTCNNCGNSIPDGSKFCQACGTLAGFVNTPSANATYNQRFGPAAMVQRAETSQAQKMTSRYKDAYRVGRAIVGVGDVIKVLGGALAAIIFIGALYANTQVRGEIGVAIMIVAIGFAAFAGVLFFVMGTLIAAQGQILKATLDSAINSSPFITDDNRAEIMSLK